MLEEWKAPITALKAKLDEIGWPCWVSCEQSNTVFFTRPKDEIIRKYTLATDYDERFDGELAHVNVMQNATTELIDRFVEDLKAQQEEEALALAA